MRNRRKKLVALGVAAMMAATLMSGCGKKATPENLLKDMVKNVEDAESAVANMKFVIEMGDETATIGIDMDLDMEMDLKTQEYHGKGAMDMTMMGTNVGTEIEIYSVKEDEQYVTYMMASGQWAKEVMDESTSDMLDDFMEMTDSTAVHADSFEMTKNKVDVNGKKCFEMKGDIKGSDIMDMLESGMEQGLGTGFDEEVMENLSIPCTIAVYEDDILPAKISFDMQSVMEDAMKEAEGEGATVSECYIEVTYEEYDSIEKIEVPAEVIEEAGGIPDDGDLDDDDDKEPAKSDKKAEQSKELGEKWDSYTVQINDKVVTLPCSFADLESAGVKLDEEYTPKTYVVNAGEYELAWFEDANGNSLTVNMSNTGLEPKELTDCLVTGISVEDYDIEEGGMTVIFPGGIKIGTPEADVLAAYGEATDTYDNAEYGKTYYWYDKDNYYNACTIGIDAESKLVDSLDIECGE